MVRSTGSMVGRAGSLVGGPGSISTSRSMIGRGSRGMVVVGISRVLNIGNIARVVISNIVGHGLGATIRKINRVGTIGGVTVPVLIGIEPGARVIIGNIVGVLVVGRLIIALLVTIRGASIGAGRGISAGGGIGAGGGIVGSPGIVGKRDGGKSQNNNELKM